MSRVLSLAIVGADYPNKRGPGRRFEIALCKPGDPIELRPEPENKHDANAIAVYSERDVQLGYVSADRTALIRQALANAREPIAIFQEATSWGGWVRVGLGIQPTLPIPRPPVPTSATTPDAWDNVDYMPPNV